LLTTPKPPHCYKTKEVQETITFLFVSCQIFTDLKKFTDNLTNKPFLM